MPEITSPFDEQKRTESPGEAQQRLASMAKMLWLLVGGDLTESERQALAVVIGAVMRRWPHLKNIGST